MQTPKQNGGAVHYEPHPVTPERKAELRAQGLRIVDIRFAPATHKQPVADQPVDERSRIIAALEAAGAKVDRRKGTARLKVELEAL